VDSAVRAIIAAKPDVVLSAVVGDSAIAFAKKLRDAGVRPDKTPVLTFALGENELRGITRQDMVGNYAAWNYFQSVDRPENLAFVKQFKARFGSDRTISAVMEASYNSVRLWAQAVTETGSTDVRQVRFALRHQSLNAPEGIIAIDPETQHTWVPAAIGRIRADGQFDIVWTSGISVRPVPFPLTRTREAWEAFVEELHQRWGGKWAAPTGLTTEAATQGTVSP
jgi:urea transport system substrate-binding protein